MRLTADLRSSSNESRAGWPVEEQRRRCWTRGTLNEERSKIRASCEPKHFSLSTALLSSEHLVAQASLRIAPGNKRAPSSEASAMEVWEKDFRVASETWKSVLGISSHLEMLRYSTSNINNSLDVACDYLFRAAQGKIIQIASVQIGRERV